MPTTPSGGGVSADTLYFTEEFNDNEGLKAGRIYLGGTLMAKPSVWEELPEPLPEFAVDLGLPSGRLWADRNVGAASPERFGDYFMWGSTTPDTNKPCGWEHAPFNNGSSSFDSGYFSTVSATVCPGGVLASKYDAAHVIMGGRWRMPTSDEIRELLDSTVQSVESLDGARGMCFTAPNGNSIFMPFAGRRNGSVVNDLRSAACAWSSSLNAGDARYSYYIGFGKTGNVNVSSYGRGGGFSVRGVC